MSDMKASVTETKAGFHVEGYEKIEYDFTFIDNIFDKQKGELAECFKRWKRCLAVMDMNIFNVYGKAMQEYFDHHGLELKIHKTMIGEKAKSIETFLSIVDSMNEFGMPSLRLELEVRADSDRHHQKGTSSSCRRRTGH